MVQQNGCIESVKKVVGNISTTNTTNYFSGNGEKEDNIMNAMNKKLNIISEMSRSLLDRIVRIETELDERNILNAKLLDMI